MILSGTSATETGYFRLTIKVHHVFLHGVETVIVECGIGGGQAPQQECPRKLRLKFHARLDIHAYD